MIEYDKDLSMDHIHDRLRLLKAYEDLGCSQAFEALTPHVQALSSITFRQVRQLKSDFSFFSIKNIEDKVDFPGLANFHDAVVALLKKTIAKQNEQAAHGVFRSMTSFLSRKLKFKKYQPLHKVYDSSEEERESDMRLHDGVIDLIKNYIALSQDNKILDYTTRLEKVVQTAANPHHITDTLYRALDELLLLPHKRIPESTYLTIINQLPHELDKKKMLVAVVKSRIKTLLQIQGGRYTSTNVKSAIHDLLLSYAKDVKITPNWAHNNEVVEMALRDLSKVFTESDKKAEREVIKELRHEMNASLLTLKSAQEIHALRYSTDGLILALTPNLSQA